MDDLTDRVKAAARSHGADAVGVARAEAYPEVREDLAARAASGLSGPLRFTYADPATAADPTATFPWARRMVAVGRSYVPDAGTTAPGPGEGAVARFATEDHYRPLADVTDAVVEELSSAGHRAEAIADDPRVVDRAVAVAAGIGWWGKNTLVIAPRVGPWMLLASVATDAPLVVDEPMRRDCGTCSACLPACPTGALVAPGVLDARRCLATWLQSPGEIPMDLRVPMGGRIYGCDDCLDACPPGVRLASTAPPTTPEDLVALLRLDDEQLLDRFAHWYVPRRQGRYIRRNLVIALANTGGPEHLSDMVDLARHQSGLVRTHAAWGIARLGTRHRLVETARAHLADLIAEETVAEVLMALEEAERGL